MQPATINNLTRVVSAKLNTSDIVAKGVFVSSFCFPSEDLQQPTMFALLFVVCVRGVKRHSLEFCLRTNRKRDENVPVTQT